MAETPGRTEQVRDVAASSPVRARRKGNLPTPPAPDDTDPIWHQLCATLAWYEHSATLARIAFWTLRVLAIMVASFVALFAVLGAPAAITVTFAVFVVVLEGAHRVFRFRATSIRYREAAETLRRTGHQYAERVPPYDTDDRRARLAELLEVTITSE